MPDPLALQRQQDPKESVLAQYAGALFIRCDPAQEVRYPVVILQNEKANVYHVLEKHFRAEFLAAQERYWKLVKSLYNPPLETWRPRVNGVQLKVLQGARLPECEAEWAALDAALAALAPFLRSDSSVAALSSELRDFARILDVWWANRKRGEGGLPPNKRPSGPILALPMNKRQSLEFVQQEVFSGPIFVQPEIITHSILGPSLMIQSKSADSMDLFFTHPPSAFAAPPGPGGGLGSAGPVSRDGLSPPTLVPQSVPLQQGNTAGQGPMAEEPGLLHPTGGSQTLDPQGFTAVLLETSAGSAPPAAPGLGSRCASGAAEVLPRVQAPTGPSGGGLEALVGTPTSQPRQTLPPQQQEAATAQQQQQAAALLGPGTQDWGGDAHAHPLSPQASFDDDLDKVFVALNVGGHRFLTTAATLAAVEGSFLWKLAQQCGDGGDGSTTPEYFIDRSGKLFEYVLDYLRCTRFGERESMLPREARALAALAREANFYCMPELAKRATAALQQEQQRERPQAKEPPGEEQQGETAAAAATAAGANPGGRVVLDALFLETGMQPAGNVASAQAALVQQLNCKLAVRQSEGYVVVRQECGTEREGSLRNLFYHVMLRKQL